jgi:structural maintenance of chromosome 3 (chondroitin sulfate proteoglycan 6)
LWREDAKGTASLDTMKQELHKNERTLAGCMDKSTSQGLLAVRRIASKLNLDGVYGPLYELFDVDDVYTAAVEVICGSRCF